MNRKKFIQDCGMACMSTAGALAMGSALTGCSGMRSGRGTDADRSLGTGPGGRGSRRNIGLIEGDDLVVPVSAFSLGGTGSNRFKPSVIVHPDILKFPIIIYRFTAGEYSAVWMQCTHQGAELQAFGSTLQCPAHGSEFSSKGQVTSGPANLPLRTFAVRMENDHLKISLKAV